MESPGISHAISTSAESFAPSTVTRCDKSQGFHGDRPTVLVSAISDKERSWGFQIRKPVVGGTTHRQIHCQRRSRPRAARVERLSEGGQVPAPRSLSTDLVGAADDLHPAGAEKESAPDRFLAQTERVDVGLGRSSASRAPATFSDHVIDGGCDARVPAIAALARDATMVPSSRTSEGPRQPGKAK